MSQESNKVVVPAEIVAGKKGAGACEAVYNWVKAQSLPADTVVYYWNPIANQPSDLWNKVSSIVPVVKDGKITDWNGGFRTKLGAALNGHTSEEVNAAKGTGSSQPKAEGSAPAKSRVFKVGVKFDGDTAILDFGENSDELLFDPATKTVRGAADNGAISITTFSVYSRKITEFASDPWTTIKNAGEFTLEGALVQAGYQCGAYNTAETDPAKAGQAILNAAIAKSDVAFVKEHLDDLLQGKGMEFTGNSRKSDWMAKWEPKPAPAAEPVKPSEEPSTLNAKVADEGLRVDVPATTEPAKKPESPAKRAKIQPVK